MAHRNSNIGIYPTRSDWDDTRHFGYRNRDHFSGAPSDKERFEKGYGYDEPTRPTRDFTGVGPKNYRRSDKSIHDEVCDLLTLHPRVDPSEIEVQVKDGIVTLLGTVSDREAKRMAEDTALDVRGVLDVHNHLYPATRLQNQRMLEGRWESHKKALQGRKGNTQ